MLVPGCQAACGDTEQDRIVWARERMHPGVTGLQLDLVYRWLVNGTSSCNLSGDLWYYRGLVARRMGNSSDANYALRKADDNYSRAKSEGFDPFAAPAHGPAVPSGKTHDKFALLVGVTKFQKSFDFLEFSGKDATEFGNFLVRYGNFPKDNVKVLVDENATTGKIREAFGDIRAKAKADDLVVIYISSHGHPRDLDPTGLSYVLTYDTDTESSAKVYATGLQMVELAELGRWTLARDYVLLLDTCYSGAAKPGVVGKIVPAGTNGLDPLQGLQGSGNRAVISASRADEQSFEDPQNKHGFFTRFLLEALRQEGAKPLSSIYDYVGTHVSTEVALQDGRQQHPVVQYFGAGNGIVLNTPREAAWRGSGKMASRLALLVGRQF
jgi:hypothetical protein